MRRMVVGFVFYCGRVLLIKKTHPAWQAGRYNGVGGKLRNHEEPLKAMEREFCEEVGLTVPTTLWVQSAVMRGPDWEVTVFGAFADISAARQTTDEVPLSFEIGELPCGEMIDNLEWLVPLTFQKLQRKEPFSVEVTYTQ